MARLSSVMTLISVSAARKWPLFQMDFKNAFLNGELSKEVYMRLPLGYSHPPGFPHIVFVRPEKFQFLEKEQNRNFDYKFVNFG